MIGSILSWIAETKLGRFVLDYVWGKLLSLVVGWINDWKAKRAIEKDSKESVEPLKDAQTQEEIDEAARKALDHL